MSAELQVYVGGMVSTNGYVLKLGESCIVIDAPNGIYEHLQSQGLKPDALLLTHQHYDHVEDAAQFSEAGVPIYSYAPYDEDLVLIKLAQRWGFDIEVAPYEVTTVLEGTDEIEVAGHPIRLSHVPGHSLDSVTFYFSEEGLLFSGDTLFQGSIGRPDLPNGNQAQLLDGIKTKLFALPDETDVLPGHGGNTSIGAEKATNPYLR